MFKALITSRRFAPLFWCQFLSALNDNFVKNALVILILFKIGSESGGALVALAGAVLVAPFFILSGIGGELADRYDKAVVAEKLKRAEIPVAMIAALGFVLQSVPLLFVALGLYGVIAALFGPIKYGILPALLEPKELPAGNAFVESATFAAILIGTIGGGMAASDSNGVWVLAGLVVGLAVLCWFSASLIPKMGAAAPGLAIDFNPWTSTKSLLTHLRSDRRLWVGGLITSWFWLVGTVVLSLLPVLIKDIIGGGESVAILALVVFTIGIAIGSAGAARASRTRPNLALVPIGALLMGCFALDLAWTASGLVKSPEVLTVGGLLASVTGWRILIDLDGPRRCRRFLHRAGVRRGSALGARRRARADHRRVQRAVRAVHDRREPRHCDAAVGGRRASAAAVAAGCCEPRRDGADPARLGQGRHPGCRRVPVQDSSWASRCAATKTCRRPGRARSSRPTM